MSKYKIALIIPYFGQLPNYFDIWLLSCKFNQSIDWILFTDDKTKYNYPKNVYVNYITFNEFRNRIQLNFDFKIELENPYKLCDYKTAYGEVFNSLLLEYDYWGYCDVDLIWGNIRKFITDDILEEYDKISDAGHFTLYKNNNTLNTAYRKLYSKNCYNYKSVFTSADSFAFDEWGGNKGINRILIDNGFKIFFEKIVFADININNYGLRNSREGYGDTNSIKLEKSKENIAYRFDKGIITQYSVVDKKRLIANEEMYVHFQKRPMVKNIKIDKSTCSFLVVPPNKFIDDVDEITIEYLKYRCKENRVYLNYYIIRYKNLVKKIKKIKEKLIL